MGALKPIVASVRRSEMIFCSPVKAPPQMNRMLLVSMATCSVRGFLRPPRSGTLTVVPSSILSKACCTPSPETSRVIAMASERRASLSISSMYTMPTCVASTFCPEFWYSLWSTDSTSSPTYPACVRHVASAMAKGTSTSRARVRASRVLPEPVGPRRRMLDLSSSSGSLASRSINASSSSITASGPKPAVRAPGTAPTPTLAAASPGGAAASVSASTAPVASSATASGTAAGCVRMRRRL
mmetsp:Transcript_33191/g.87224  ORF Transcript_33191/g.87224 Transcript_33191/m.87224 type:complete len:241 (+) Transcript_33191:1195-1917(+)